MASSKVAGAGVEVLRKSGLSILLRRTQPMLAVHLLPSSFSDRLHLSSSPDARVHLHGGILASRASHSPFLQLALLLLRLSREIDRAPMKMAALNITRPTTLLCFHVGHDEAIFLFIIIIIFLGRDLV